VTVESTKQDFSIKTALIASLAILALFGLMITVRVLQGEPLPLESDSDSNMRLQQVRDLLAGQNWYDLVLRRFGLGEGTNMHWSRLADLGPAALLWFFSQFLSAPHSELAMTITYPLLLVIPFALALLWIANRIAANGKQVQTSVALGFVVIQLEVWRIFSPGLIDHHNLQIIALLVFLGGCCGVRTFKSGLIAAAGLVLGLVVGPDGLPAIVATIAALGILWLLNPKGESEFLFGLGAGTLALTMLCGFVFIPHPVSTAWCDSWTLPLSSIVAGLGAFLLVAAWLGTLTQNKLVLLGVSLPIGIGMLATLILIFPACRNPLPLSDPLLQRYWMSLLSDNLPVWEIAKDMPSAAALFAPSLLVIVGYIFALRQKWFRLDTSLPAIVALLGALVLASAFLRGLPILATVTAPILAGLLSQALANAPTVKHRIYAWLICAPIVSISMANLALNALFPQKSVAQQDVSKSAASKAYFCIGPDELSRIQKLPKGTMISSFFQTEYLVRTTNLNMVFGGYHRAYETNLEIIKWLISKPEVAKEKLLQNNISYLSVCLTSGQLSLMGTENPDSLVAAVNANEPPSWLQPIIPLQDGGMIYQVVDK
jgi:hypothetical protein